MTSHTSLRPGSRRTMALCLLTALCLVASACGTSSEQPSAAPSVLTNDDGPEYGDSLDEFNDASGAGEVGHVNGETVAPATVVPDGFDQIQWEDLIPPGSSTAEISARFDERIAAVEPGTPEADAVFAELSAEFENQPVNAEIAGQDIFLAGFVAPLTYSGDLVTEFLLVPYFGACIHVPAPPANQTIMVTLAEGEGLTIDESWGPIWVTGTMTIDGAETDLATAGYSISDADFGVHIQS